MKKFLMAAVLAASTLGLAGGAMAATLDQVSASDGSFIKQQSLQYSTNNGQ